MGFIELNSAIPTAGGGLNASTNICQSSAKASSGRVLTFTTFLVLSHPSCVAGDDHEELTDSEAFNSLSHCLDEECPLSFFPHLCLLRMSEKSFCPDVQFQWKSLRMQTFLLPFCRVSREAVNKKFNFELILFNPRQVQSCYLHRFSRQRIFFTILLSQLLR